MSRVSSFFSKIGFVSAGLAAGAILGFLALPFLTRIYSIEDFGAYGLAMAFVSVFSSVVCLKMEQAILVCGKEKVSSILFFTCTFILLFCFLLLVIGLFFYEYMIYIAAAVFTNGILQLSYSIFLKKNQELYCGVMNFFRVASLIIPQLLLPFFLDEPSMLYGLIIQFLFVIAFYGIKVFKEIEFGEIRFNNFIEYRSFARDNTLHSIVNSVSNNVPYYFLSYFYGMQTVGYYSLVDRVLKVPIFLFSQILRQTFIRDFSKSKNKKNTASYSLKISRFMLIIYVSFLVVLVFTPDFLYASLFGSEWIGLGKYFLILGIGYGAVFTNPPVSAWLIANNFSHKLLKYQTIEFVVKLFSMIVFSLFFSETYTLLIIAFSLVLYNSLIYFRVYRESL